MVQSLLASSLPWNFCLFAHRTKKKERISFAWTYQNPKTFGVYSTLKKVMLYSSLPIEIFTFHIVSKHLASTKKISCLEPTQHISIHVNLNLNTHANIKSSRPVSDLKKDIFLLATIHFLYTQNKHQNKRKLKN